MGNFSNWPPRVDWDRTDAVVAAAERGIISEPRYELEARPLKSKSRRPRKTSKPRIANRKPPTL